MRRSATGNESELMLIDAGEGLNVFDPSGVIQAIGDKALKEMLRFDSGESKDQTGENRWSQRPV